MGERKGNRRGRWEEKGWGGEEEDREHGVVLGWRFADRPCPDCLSTIPATDSPSGAAHFRSLSSRVIWARKHRDQLHRASVHVEKDC